MNNLSGHSLRYYYYYSDSQHSPRGAAAEEETFVTVSHSACRRRVEPPFNCKTSKCRVDSYLFNCRIAKGKMRMRRIKFVANLIAAFSQMFKRILGIFYQSHHHHIQDTLLTPTRRNEPMELLRGNIWKCSNYSGY